MEHRHFHWLEKIQVQIAALAALAVVYFGLTPAIGPWDDLRTDRLPADRELRPGRRIRRGPAGDVRGGGRRDGRHPPRGRHDRRLGGRPGRPASLSQIRSLLWAREQALPGLFRELALEVAVLGLVLLAISGVIGLVRTFVARVKPGWIWRNPLEQIADPERKKVAGRAGDAANRAGSHWGGIGALVGHFAWRGSREAGRRLTVSRELTRLAGCFTLAAAVSVVVLLLLMQSADRGQILSALFISYLAGMLVGHQVFPTVFGSVAWILPILTGIVLYLLGSAAVGANGPLPWLAVPHYARALPIDWATAGAGGAVLGFWMSSRVHEAQYLEKHVKTQGA